MLTPDEQSEIESIGRLMELITAISEGWYMAGIHVREEQE